MAGLQSEIISSPRVKALLSESLPDGTLPHHPYSKWDGAHWVLSILADLEHPPGDQALIPLREQDYTFYFTSSQKPYLHQRFNKLIDGRTRVCASIEANTLYALLKLGLSDERCDLFASLLMGWQWQDGGWNCDKNPTASHSSFHETLIPMRALALYAQKSGDSLARASAERAAEVFLKRRLLFRMSDNKIIDPNFAKLHYPCYWHYDYLFGLKVLAEMGLISDPRCQTALDLLESKRLPDSGFPAEAKFYHHKLDRPGSRSLVDWGGTSRVHANPWVTLDAFYVLKAAGRSFLP